MDRAEDWAVCLLDVSRPNLSLLLNRRIDLSAETAPRLDAAFGRKVAMLLGMQTAYSLANVRERRAAGARSTLKFRAIMTQKWLRNGAG